MSLIGHRLKNWWRWRIRYKKRHLSEMYTPEREEIIQALEKLKVKSCGGDMELTYIGNGLSERLKPFGIEGELEK